MSNKSKYTGGGSPGRRKWKMKYVKFMAFVIGVCCLFLTTPFFTAAGAADEDGGKRLAAYSVSEFKREVIKVTDGVYIAVGFGGANSILLEGNDGIVIVDTLEGMEAAEGARAAFDKITSKPLKAIIYTHSHRDHSGGAKAFVGNNKIDIYGRESFGSDLLGDAKIGAIIGRRTARQFGIGLSPNERISIGIGPGNRPVGGLGAGYIPPNKTFSGERMELEIAGIKMELVAAPGETDDHIFVWLPEKKVLLCGDNYYKAFPNLYAIRGTRYRDVEKWADSLNKMVGYNAQYLLPGHSRPVIGQELVRQTLSNYRDAIRFVLNKTVEGMNKGLTPDELVQFVKLPSELADKPYLQEYYGVVEWSVKGIYDGLIGWFDGNATHLFPMTPADEAKRVAALAGGKDALMKQAKDAHAAKDYQWVLQLCDYLIALDPKSSEPKLLKADTCAVLAERQISANARNYYFAAAKELREQAKGGAQGVK
jgi:alkyl sulfatase BDS1-like metallo-beta-lactamase superfamily hydrolase